MRALLMTVLLFSTLAPFALADLIVTRDGRRIEGKILAERGDAIEVLVERASLKAKVLVKRSDIVRIERRATRHDALKQAYAAQRGVAERLDSARGWEDLATWCHQRNMTAERRLAIELAFDRRQAIVEASPTAAAWAELARWAQGWSLKRQARACYGRALAYDGDLTEARLALGYVKLDGRWLTPEEAAEAVADANRRKGLVLHDGQWMTPEAARFKEDLRTRAEQAALLEQLKRALARQSAELAAERTARAALEARLLQLERDAQRAIDTLASRLRRLEREVARPHPRPHRDDTPGDRRR